MKKSLFIFLIISTQIFSQTIKGTLMNSENCKKIFIFEYIGSNVFLFDSANVANDTFEFPYKEPIPRGYYKLGPSLEKSIDIILGKENIEITGDCESFSTGVKLSGSNENYGNYVWNTYNQEFNIKVESIKQKSTEIFSRYQQGDPELLKQRNILQQEYDSLEMVKYDYYLLFSNQYPGTFIGKVSFFYGVPRLSNDTAAQRVFSNQREYTKATFIQPQFFTDEEMTHGAMLEQKLVMYLQTFFQNDFVSGVRELQRILELTPSGSRCREVVFHHSIKLLGNQDPEFNRQWANRHLKEFPNSKLAKKSVELTGPLLPLDMGGKAPEIVMPGIDGKNISLSSLKGKIVLIDFWASWCGPCRKENPVVVKAYQKFKNKKFDIFSVSLDNSKENWKNAIVKDNLTWKNHVSDLLGWQNKAAKAYSVTGIPANFLIDGKGFVIGKNLRGPALEEKLNEVFGKGGK